MKVAIIYDFFPHYRSAVMRELLNSTEHEYVLVADERPIDPTIKPWPVEDQTRFVHAPYRKVFGNLYHQAGLLGVVLQRDIGAVIYMAYPNFISTWISALAARLAGKKVFFWT